MENKILFIYKYIVLLSLIWLNMKEKKMKKQK